MDRGIQSVTDLHKVRGCVSLVDQILYPAALGGFAEI